MKGIVLAFVLLTAVSCSNASSGVSEVVSASGEDGPANSVDRFVADSAGTAIIHAIGVYEGGSRHSYGNHPRETIKVTIASQGSRIIYLALSSYEPVDWEIDGPGADAVKGVFLAGYHDQRAIGLTSARVVNRSGNSFESSGFAPEPEETEEPWSGVQGPSVAGRRVSCTYTYAAPSGGGCDSASSFVASAEQAFGAKLATFTGTYSAKAFRISAWPEN